MAGDIYANLVGELLADRYQVESLLGKGGMGAVYRARQLDLGRPVALKVLHDDLAADATQLERFKREAMAAASLGHRNVVQVTDLHVLPGQLAFLVMELVEGRSLAQVIKTEGRLELGRVVAIGQQVLSALDAAHAAGIVHRDVKPPNIMLEEFPVVGEVVKLLDFGVVKMHEGAGAAKLTQTGVAIGTPAYMSPEQVLGQGVDHRTDIYAVGVVLFKSLSGRLPFESGVGGPVVERLVRPPVSLAEVVPGLPPSVTAIVDRALSPAPIERFQSAAEMATALATSTGAAATPSHSAENAPTWSEEFTPIQPLGPASEETASGPTSVEGLALGATANTAFAATVQPPSPPMATAPGAGPERRTGRGKFVAIGVVLFLLGLGATGAVLLAVFGPWDEIWPADTAAATAHHGAGATPAIPQPIAVSTPQPSTPTVEPAPVAAPAQLPPLPPLGRLVATSTVVCTDQRTIAGVSVSGGGGGGVIAGNGCDLTIRDSAIGGVVGVLVSGSGIVRLRNCRVNGEVWGITTSGNGAVFLEGGSVYGSVGSVAVADNSVVTTRGTRLDGRTSVTGTARIDNVQ